MITAFTHEPSCNRAKACDEVDLLNLWCLWFMVLTPNRYYNKTLSYWNSNFNDAVHRSIKLVRWCLWPPNRLGWQLILFVKRTQCGVQCTVLLPDALLGRHPTERSKLFSGMFEDLTYKHISLSPMVFMIKHQNVTIFGSHWQLEERQWSYSRMCICYDPDSFRKSE